jgi:DNA uptake protein ComE-like DNA-binding protein
VRHLTVPRLLAAAAFLALTAPTASAVQAGANESLLNPNLAGEEELLAVSSLDGEVVAAILEHRPFLAMADLHAVLAEHVGAEAFDGLYRRIWIPIDLNDVTNEEILLIPGVGDRMLNEFEEYRPYAGLAQFEREIGKYIDEEEMARLSQYVFVQIDLNDASEEAILSIPGVGSRLLREFREYRPYRSIEQFRREMGKYVDDGEVARLERYLTIR